MRPLVVFDLDGTLSDASHRQHLVDRTKLQDGVKPDWRAFYAACGGDAPLHHTIAVARALHMAGYELWLFSGRSDEVIGTTQLWLQKYAIDELLSKIKFRAAGNTTPDDVLKMQWYDAMSDTDRKRLLLVFDDRDRMVAAWRARGVPCFQVAAGSF